MDIDNKYFPSHFSPNCPISFPIFTVLVSSSPSHHMAPQSHRAWPHPSSLPTPRPCVIQSQPGMLQGRGRWTWGTARVCMHSSLFLSTPLTVFTRRSFPFKTVSLSTNSTNVPRMRVHSVSCLHLGNMARMRSMFLMSGGLPWSLSNSSIFPLTQPKAALTL